MLGLRCKHWNDIEGGGLGFVCFSDLARFDKVLVTLYYMLTPYNEEVNSAALYLIPIQGSVVELHSLAIAIRAPLQWKDRDLPICSSVPRINLGLVGQGSEPLIDKSLVHYGALKGPVHFREVHSYILPLVILELLVTPLI